MASASINLSSSLVLHEFGHPLPRDPKFSSPNSGRIRSPVRISASSRRDAHGQNYFGGRLVDESMIVLRKRIHEAKMAEKNYEPPSHWMEWEKRYYTRYDSIVCDIVGALQTQLMDARPSVALGAVALIVLSVPTSAALLAARLIEMIH